MLDLLQKIVKPGQTWLRLKFGDPVKKIRLFWQTNVQHRWRKFAENPAIYIEALFYLTLSFLTKITPVPFIITTDRSDESWWCRPALEPRSGFALSLVIAVQALLIARSMLFVSLSFTHRNFVTMRHGMLTADALIYFTFLLFFAWTYILVTVSIIHRKKFAQIFNSYGIFSELHGKNYAGKRAILNKLEQDGRLCIMLVGICQSYVLVPFLAAGAFFYYRDSPVTLSCLLIGKVNASDNWIIRQVYSAALFFTDWAWITVGTFGSFCTVYTLGIPFVGVILGIRSLRPTEQRAMSSVARLLERRKLHVQLELLTSMLNNLIRDLLPPVILIVFLVAVFLNVLLAKANGSQLKDRYPLAVTIIVAWSFLFTLGGFLFLRLTASLRADSLEVLCSMQLLPVPGMLVLDGIEFRGRSKVIAVGRALRRRKPLELNFGHFGAIAGGHGITYATAVLENTVNLVFMVDATGEIYVLGLK